MGFKLLDPAEQAMVRVVADGIVNAPPPKDPSPYGCLAAVLAAVILLILPVFGPRLGIEGRLAFGVGALSALVVLAGAGLHLIGGGFVRGATISDAEQAIDGLENWTGDREQAIRSSVVLLMNATVEYGPTSSTAFDPEQVADRIHRVLPLVKIVEELLVRENRCDPVFSVPDLNRE